jgi:hypothetical protein
MSRTWLRQLRKRLTGGTSPSRPARRKPSSAPLAVEFLETREMLSTAPGLIGGGLTGDPPPPKHPIPNPVHGQVVNEDALTLSAPRWDVNQPYSGTISNFGSAQATLKQVSGLPAGLSATLSGTTVTIRGTPTQSGTFDFGLEADTKTTTPAGIYETAYDGVYALTINPALALGVPSVSQWTAGQAGSSSIPISGGTPGYSNLTVTGLPPGLSRSLSANAVTLTGTPTQAGTFSNVVVSLKDAIGATVRKTYTLTVNLALSPGALSPATDGQGYRATLAASGGSGHYSFSLASGVLPAGLSLSSAGVLSGTPAAKAGGYHFTVRATDTANAGASCTQTYALTVDPAAATRLAFSVPTPVTAGQGFEASVQALDPYGNGVPGVAITVTGVMGQIGLRVEGPLGQTGLGLSLPRVFLLLLDGVTDAQGNASFSITAPTQAGTYSLTASGPAGLASVTDSYTVVGGSPYNLALTVSTNQATAGSSFNVSVTATDMYGNTPNGAYDVWLKSSDDQPVTPEDIELSNGAGSAPVTLYQADQVTLTASWGPSVQASAPITVNAAAATHFAVTPAARWADAGTPLNLTVTAQDPWNNTDTGYGSTVTLTSSDGQAVSPSAVPLSNGTATVPVTLGPATSGDVTFTATAGELSGTSPSVHFLPQAGNGPASRPVTDSANDTLVLYGDGTVWEQTHGASLWDKVEDSVARLVRDAHGNVFSLDWYGNLNKLTSLYVWTTVQGGVVSLVRDQLGDVFALNSGDHRVYEYSGDGWAGWSDWAANSVPYLHVESLVSDATNNVFVQAGRDEIYVHWLGSSTGWVWLGNGGTDLVTNAAGQLFVLDDGYHTVCQIGQDHNGAWSTGSPWTTVLTGVSHLAALPNGTLLAVGTDGIVRSSTTGQSGTWQASLDTVPGGVYTIAVTPNGTVYALGTTDTTLYYSTTGLPGSWNTAQFYAPGYGQGTGLISSDVLGLANGQDGQVYFFAAGNVYEVLTDGIGTVVRAHFNTQSWNSLSAALVGGRVDVVAQTCSYLQRVDGTNSTSEAVLQSVAQAVHATFSRTGDVQVVYDGTALGHEASDLAKDVSDLVHETSAGLRATDALKLGFDLVGDIDSDPSAQIDVNVAEIFLNVAAIALAC